MSDSQTYEDPEIIQARMRERYAPREGETWDDAATRHGRLTAQIIIHLRAIGSARAPIEIDRLTGAEVAQLAELLEKLADVR